MAFWYYGTGTAWPGTNWGPLEAIAAAEELTAKIRAILAFARLLALFLARKIRRPRWAPPRPAIRRRHRAFRYAHPPRGPPLLWTRV